MRLRLACGDHPRIGEQSNSSTNSSIGHRNLPALGLAPGSRALAGAVSLRHRLARHLVMILPMDNLHSPETDCYLLSIDERDFADVAAVLGLRARPASPDDEALVDAYLREKDIFAESQTQLLITTVPNIRPQ